MMSFSARTLSAEAFWPSQRTAFRRTRSSASLQAMRISSRTASFSGRREGENDALLDFRVTVQAINPSNRPGRADPESSKPRKQPSDGHPSPGPRGRSGAGGREPGVVVAAEDEEHPFPDFRIGSGLETRFDERRTLGARGFPSQGGRVRGDVHGTQECSEDNAIGVKRAGAGARRIARINRAGPRRGGHRALSSPSRTARVVPRCFPDDDPRQSPEATVKGPAPSGRPKWIPAHGFEPRRGEKRSEGERQAASIRAAANRSSSGAARRRHGRGL